MYTIPPTMSGILKLVNTTCNVLNTDLYWSGGLVRMTILYLGSLRVEIFNSSRRTTLTLESMTIQFEFDSIGNFFTDHTVCMLCQDYHLWSSNWRSRTQVVNISPSCLSSSKPDYLICFHRGLPWVVPDNSLCAYDNGILFSLPVPNSKWYQQYWS